MDRQLYLLKATFCPQCMVLVRITVKVIVSVKSLRVRVRLRISVSRVRCSMGMENSACHVYLSVPDGKYHQAFGFGFQVFYSVLLQTTLHSSAQLSKRSSTTDLPELIQPLSDVD